MKGQQQKSSDPSVESGESSQPANQQDAASGLGSLASGAGIGQADALAMNSAVGNGFVAESLGSGGDGPEAYGGFARGNGGGTGDGDGPAAPATGTAGPAPAAGTTGSTQIYHATEKPAPANGDFDRTVVGLGEKVGFWTLVDGGSWSSSSGRGARNADGGYDWTAPGTPGSVTITFTKDGQSSTLTIVVLAPMFVTAESHGAPATPVTPGHAGKAMSIPIIIGPTQVSFGALEWLEDPGPAISSGYWATQNQQSLYHTPNLQWSAMGDDNRNITDQAGYDWYDPGGYAPGGNWIWIIPNRYRMAGQGGGTVFWVQPQVMTIDSSGGATVSKFGQSI